MKKLLVIFFIALLAAILVAGCAKPAPAPTTAPPPASATKPAPSSAPATVSPKYGGTLKEVAVSVPDLVGWPPALTGASTETPQVVFDPFLRADNKGGYHPWLAESYKLADDLMSITFKLRKDVKFHDGSVLNAAVAKWNIDNQIAAKMVPYWKSVDVLDDYTVRVNFTEWLNTLLGGFADGSATWMASKEAYDKNGEAWMRENPVGTGPFKFVSFARDTNFVAVKNPNWWQKDKPYLDRYEVLYVVEPTTQLALMQSGGADAIGLEPGKQASDMEKLGLTMYVDVVSVFGLVPDTSNPDSIWANKKFREAVEYAIDREAIAKSLGYGYLKAPYQLPPRSNVNYDPNFVGRRYDPNKAKQLLTEAGYPNGAKAKIIVTSLAPSKDAIIAMQAYLAAVGIQVELDFPQWSKFVTYLRGTWKDAALFQVFPALGGTNFNGTLMYYLSPTAPMLKSWERTPDFVKLLDASTHARDVDPALIKAVLNYIYENDLVIPIHEAGRGYAVRPYVKNGDWLTRGMSAFKNIEQIWLDK